MLFTCPVTVKGPASLFCSVIFILPSVAGGARRLHATDKTGWWKLLWITVIGGVLIIIWQATLGEKKKNRYGTPVKK